MRRRKTTDNYLFALSVFQIFGLVLVNYRMLEISDNRLVCLPAVTIWTAWNSTYFVYRIANSVLFRLM